MEETLNLSFDRLLMVMICVFNYVHTAAISPNCTNQLVFLKEEECTFCSVDPECCSNVLINFSRWPCQASGAVSFTPGQSMWDF